MDCARQRKITLNSGMRMRGWYDLYSLDKINEGEDVEGLKESMRSACMRPRTFPACQDVCPPCLRTSDQHSVSLTAVGICSLDQVYRVPDSSGDRGGHTQSANTAGRFLPRCVLPCATAHGHTLPCSRSAQDENTWGGCAGGATALLLLRSSHKLAGVLALSSYLPMRAGHGNPLAPANLQTPVLMLHGDADPTVRTRAPHT